MKAISGAMVICGGMQILLASPGKKEVFSY
jgi:hypothetical protein